MKVKLLMTWNIAHDHEQEYFEFMVREFIPGVQRLGLELSDAWATVFGEQPQIMVSATAQNTARALQILDSPEWKSLNNQLQDFVSNYSWKIVEARNGFQF